MVSVGCLEFCSSSSASILHFFPCFSIWPRVLSSLEKTLRFLRNHGVSAAVFLSLCFLSYNPPGQLFTFSNKMCFWELCFLRGYHWKAFENFCVSSVCMCVFVSTCSYKEDDSNEERTATPSQLGQNPRHLSYLKQWICKSSFACLNSCLSPS